MRLVPLFSSLVPCTPLSCYYIYLLPFLYIIHSANISRDEVQWNTRIQEKIKLTSFPRDQRRVLCYTFRLSLQQQFQQNVCVFHVSKWKLALLSGPPHLSKITLLLVMHWSHAVETGAHNHCEIVSLSIHTNLIRATWSRIKSTNYAAWCVEYLMILTNIRWWGSKSNQISKKCNRAMILG